MAKQASERASDSSTEGFSGDVEGIGNLLIPKLLPRVLWGPLGEILLTRAFLMSKMSHSCNLLPLWLDFDFLLPRFELAPDWGLGGLCRLLEGMLVACNTR